MYYEKNECPKHAASYRIQKPTAPDCFYFWNRETHFPHLHHVDGSRNILRNHGTNLLDNTTKLPEGFSTLEQEAVYSYENVSTHLPDWTVL